MKFENSKYFFENESHLNYGEFEDFHKIYVSKSAGLCRKLLVAFFKLDVVLGKR